MDFINLLFVGFSALAITSALGVIINRHPVRAVLCLVLTFVAMAGNWLLIQAEFLAVALVLVYVGAVMVLFLFVVMMLDIETDLVRQRFARYVPLGALVAVMMSVILIALFQSNAFTQDGYAYPAFAEDYSNIGQLGQALFTEFLIPFETAGVILLVAMVAAIALTFRGQRNNKAIDPAKQVRVKKSDRLTVVKMDAAKLGEQK